MATILLVTTAQKTVEFYDDQLLAILTEDNRVYVSVRHLCDALGLARRGQVNRINRHTVLSKGYGRGIVTIPPHNQQVEMGLLRVDLVPLFLAGISTSRVKSDTVRVKLEQYQEEVATVLWEAFQEGRLTTDPVFDDLLQQDSEAVQAYKMLQAMVKLARNQILIESRLDEYDNRFDGLENRIETIEAQFGDESRTVSEDQASQISQAVKAIAMALSKRSGTNQYGSVYGELYRKFGITSYKLLPANRFQEAMKFLSGWHQELVGESPF